MFESVEMWEFGVGMLIVIIGIIIKQIIKLKGRWKLLYMLMPFVFAFAISTIVWLVFHKRVSFIYERGFVWGGMAIAMYDIFLKKIMKYRNKVEFHDETGGKNAN